MKRITCILLCIVMLCSLLALPVWADIFQVSYYSEAIYAGGVVDLYAFPRDGGVEPFTYQWQAQGYGWIDLDDNDKYKGTKTNHMQLYTETGDYGDFGSIPFQCAVTDAEGTTFYTPEIVLEIYPTANLIPNMKKWGYGLYEPTLTNVSNFQTSDYVNYTGSTYAGSKVNIMCGSTPVENRAVLTNSEVTLTREIHITENGHTTKVGDNTTYIPYTVGSNAVKMEVKLHLTIGGHDLGYMETKTIKLSTSKPSSVSTAKTNTDCSLLRYTYNESQKLASIPKGTAVEVLGKDGSYYQVFYNNFVGYVGASLLNTQQPSYDPVIKNVDVTVTAPVAGEKPSLTCNILTEGCQLYKTEPVTWYDKTANKFLSSADRFQEGHSYDLAIWLAAKSGYKFQVDASYKPKLTGSINGNLPPFINKAYEQDPEEVIELTYTFVNTPKAPEVTTPTQPSEPTHTHTPSDWRTTGVYHYKICTTCGDFLEQEDHKGGVATCNEKGKCTVCGYAYIEENENHTPDTSKWIARTDMYHYHACKLCGAHCDTEDHRWSPTYLYQDKSGHAWVCADCKVNSKIEKHNPGAAATETIPQTCKDCGYIIEPAKNHKHTLTHMSYVAATCFATGTAEHYACSGCTALFSDKDGKQPLGEDVSVIIPYLTHETADVWGADEGFHWRSCRLCQTVLGETKMIHEAQDSKCATCGYVIGSGSTAQENETTSTESADSDKETKPSVNETADGTPNSQTSLSGKKNIGWAMAVMIGLVCFGVSITATVIILKRKKK